MPESPEEEQARRLRELEGKNIAHYSTLLGAWIQNRMERDKTLISLSTAGIGLLVTILITAGVNNWWEICLYVFAVICFLTTIITSLHIFQLNSKIIEDDIRGSSTEHPKLENLDKISFFAFLGGAIFASLLGTFSGIAWINNYERSESMSFQKKETQPSTPETIEKSLSGIENLKPEPNSSPLTNSPPTLPTNLDGNSAADSSSVEDPPINPSSD